MASVGVATLFLRGNHRHCGLAPEQFQGRSRRASDQYALGIVVYEWLSGDVPFHGSFFQLANQHLSALLPSLGEKEIILPPEVEQVVRKALAKNPSAT